VPLVTCLFLCFALFTAPAIGQGDPIMPLDQVERGMECEGRSVFRGTAIETFEVEILDVVPPNGGTPAGILFRASGPALGDTGLGFGFSGSPIYCPDGEGVQRNIGAVALSVDDYGNDVAIATPIEDVIDRPRAETARRAGRRGGSVTSQPLMVSGVGSIVRSRLFAAARRHGIQLLNAPATSSQVPTGTDLQPGSAVAAALSSGDIGLNGIGTVAYRDGSRIWAFGHPFEAVGRRSLLLQGAFVHAVIGNPNPPGFDGLGTYKLASAGDVAGVVDFDGNWAISGLLGPPPATIPLEVLARDASEAEIPVSSSLVADESPLNHPSGFPALSLVTSIAVSDQALNVLGSGAGSSYGRLCMQITLRERNNRPLMFCNRYAGAAAFPFGPAFAMADDAANAASLVESFERSLLHVEGVRVALELTEGSRFVKLRGASGPRSARQGDTIRIGLRVQEPRAEVRRLSFRMRVPGSVKPGVRKLRLTGAAADGGGGGFFDEAFFFGGDFDDFGSQKPPTTVKQLAERVAATHRYDGIRGTFRRRSSDDRELEEIFGADPSSAGRKLFRHPTLRIGGKATLRIRVRPAAG